MWFSRVHNCVQETVRDKMGTERILHEYLSFDNPVIEEQKSNRHGELETTKKTLDRPARVTVQQHGIQIKCASPGRKEPRKGAKTLFTTSKVYLVSPILGPSKPRELFSAGTISSIKTNELACHPAQSPHRPRKQGLRR